MVVYFFKLRYPSRDKIFFFFFYHSQNIRLSFESIIGSEGFSSRHTDLIGLSLLLSQKSVNIRYLLRLKKIFRTNLER